MSSFSPDEKRDPVQFLQIASRGSAIATHADLWRWLQNEVQPWLPHDALLIGWGDFRSGALEYDITSSAAGLRSREVPPSCVTPLLRYMRDLWVAAQHAPCQVNLVEFHEQIYGVGRAAMQPMGRMQSATVHCYPDACGGGERVFAALSTHPNPPATNGSALKLLLPFIDTALRRIPPAAAREPPRPPEEPEAPPPSGKLATLSEREREIMTWVALGKTNPEIGCILHISEFTVKNHMKSIFGKLDVMNRAQAVATIARIADHA